MTTNRQDRFVLLVVPPEATTASAATAMAMAADATGRAGPAHIFAASGIAAAKSPDATTATIPDATSEP